LVAGSVEVVLCLEKLRTLPSPPLQGRERFLLIKEYLFQTLGKLLPSLSREGLGRGALGLCGNQWLGLQKKGYLNK